MHGNQMPDVATLHERALFWDIEAFRLKVGAMS